MQFKIDSQKAKWLMPLLAVFVILESVLILQKLGVRKVYREQAEDLLENQKVAALSFSGERSLIVGQEGEIKLAMTTYKAVALDGMDIWIEYDPEKVEIANVEPTSKFSYLARNWIQPEKKRILVSMVESAIPEGVQFKAGDETVLLSVKYLGKSAGKVTFKIVKSEAGGTVLAENKTASKIDFSANDFVVALR